MYTGTKAKTILQHLPCFFGLGVGAAETASASIEKAKSSNAARSCILCCMIAGELPRHELPRQLCSSVYPNGLTNEACRLALQSMFIRCPRLWTRQTHIASMLRTVGRRPVTPQQLTVQVLIHQTLCRKSDIFQLANPPAIGSPP